MGAVEIKKGTVRISHQSHRQKRLEILYFEEAASMFPSLADLRKNFQMKYKLS
jgi:hypothetical protein